MAGEAKLSVIDAINLLKEGGGNAPEVEIGRRGEIDRLRFGGAVLLNLACWTVTGLLLLLSMKGGWPILLTGLLSAAVNVISSLLAKRIERHASSRLVLASAVAMQALLIVTAMKVSGYPTDTHLAFFIALTGLSVLCDIIAIWFAAAIIIAYHIVSGSALGNTILAEPVTRDVIFIYCLRTFLVALVAALIINMFKKVLERLEAAKADSARRAEAMRKQAQDLERALSRAKLERQERERVETEQAAERKAQINRIAWDFETSFSAVTLAIGQTALILNQTTSALSAVAQDTGESAADVSKAAQSANSAAHTLAQGVAELSHSISSVAVNVSQQNDMTTRATDRSTSGGEAMETLARHSHTIGEATRAIARIAERTNLLSLNAAIEAASAGPAGRGFTIVAQEVKALAMQASQAATEIDAFLKGIRSGTLEAERSFAEIDSAVAELADAATAIRWDVEKQRKATDTIEDFARRAAQDMEAMTERSQSLANTASSAQQLSARLDEATTSMMRHFRDLESSTTQFVENLKAG